MRARRFFALLVVVGSGVSMVPAVSASATVPGSNGPVAMEIVDAQGSPLIGVFRPGQQGITPLIGMPAIHDPAWSPDATKLTFAARASAGADLRIYVSAADGSGAVAVSAGPNDDEPAWSPDGTEIAFTHHRADGTSEVDVVSAAGGSQHTISAGMGTASWPTWAPDGTRLAVSGSMLVGDPAGPCGNACATGLYFLGADGAGNPIPFIVGAPISWSEPDWSPDGTRILVTIADATQVYGVIVVNASTGAINGGLIGGQAARRGSWSPDGMQIAVDQPAGPDPAARLVAAYDTAGNLQALIAVSAIGDPAWGSTAAAPPIVDLTMDLWEGGWTNQVRGLLQVTAQQGIADISCAVDEGHTQTIPHGISDPFHFRGEVMLFATDGDHVLSCTVTDATGASTTDAVAFREDATPPEIAGLTASPLVRRTDQVTNVSLSAVDALSGVSGGSIAYSSSSLSSSVPTTGEGSLHATIGTDLPGGIYTIEARVGDRAHNLATARIADPLVVYDTRSHTFGRGAFVPSVSSSKLPGIDGRSKLWFRFSLHYARAKATRPVGWLGLDYPRSGFHARVASLDWLARQNDRTYVVRGTAIVVGQPVPLSFIAYLTDGLGNASDSFDFRMWPQGGPVPGGLDTATYAGTGTLPAGTIVHDGPST